MFFFDFTWISGRFLDLGGFQKKMLVKVLHSSIVVIKMKLALMVVIVMMVIVMLHRMDISPFFGALVVI